MEIIEYFKPIPKLRKYLKIKCYYRDEIIKYDGCSSGRGEGFTDWYFPYLSIIGSKIQFHSYHSSSTKINYRRVLHALKIILDKLLFNTEFKQYIIYHIFTLVQSVKYGTNFFLFSFTASKFWLSPQQLLQGNNLNYSVFRKDIFVFGRVYLHSSVATLYFLSHISNSINIHK